MDWSTRRQLIYLAGFLLLVFGVISSVYFIFFRTPSTCFDGVLNQEELGIDCGGGCQAVCVSEVSSPIKRWARVFQVRDGLYDVAALIENPNKNIGAREFKYTFRVHDKDAILITDKSGTVFLNPNEQMVVFESGINAGNRVPARAFIEFDLSRQKWQRIDPDSQGVNLVVSNTNLVGGDNPSLSANITNSGDADVADVFVTAVVYDDDNNAVGVSSTFINYLSKDQTRNIFFDWPNSFTRPPTSFEIFPRVNLIKSS
ncbi:MAG: FxLYD domain-containing protein [Candidatus Taylorbacteria bacterium]|nr:FxLYD domain-containing protein [Candidatus Taylorbacteria bacterium]